MFVNGGGISTANGEEFETKYQTTSTMSPSENNVVTVVVAPGKYTFGSVRLLVNKPYVNIVSLTGNPDVMLDGINVTANNVYLKGLNCGENKFGECSSSLDNLILENCTGGNWFLL